MLLLKYKSAQACTQLRSRKCSERWRYAITVLGGSNAPDREHGPDRRAEQTHQFLVRVEFYRMFMVSCQSRTRLNARLMRVGSNEFTSRKLEKKRGHACGFGGWTRR